MTTIAPSLGRPRRWDAAFSDDMTEADAARLLTVSPFNEMNPESFPGSAPLREILKNDTCIRRFKAGEIIVREGDYGNSAFMVLTGAGQVIIAPALPPSAVGRRESKRRGIFRAIAQLWSNPAEPEVLPKSARKGVVTTKGKGGKDEIHIILQDIPAVLNKHRTASLEAGAFFGEIAALSRIPRTATIFARDEGTELLEIRWQGLRDLMKFDPKLRAYIDRIYRERALSTALSEIPLMKYLSEDAKKKVAAATQFETYGDYEWSGKFKDMAKSGAPAAKEQVVAAEEDYPNSVIIVRTGFARVTQRYGAGNRTLNYLGAGQVYGFDEIAHNWSHPGQPVTLQYTLRVMGYTHILVIPAAIIEQFVLPSLPANKLPAPIAEAEGTRSPFARRADPPRAPAASAADGAQIGPEMMEFLTQNRFFNGTEAMLINLDRCTRCDDCVRACAATHDNNPRFLRHGPIHENVMVAQACMHCTDPVCMIGCPTGAIHRDSFGGQVVVNPATCIGCTACANNCPYGNIRMVETRDDTGEILVASDAKPILKATKCDLCVDQMGGPACERACPHDALQRLNLNTLDELAAWLHR
ncbi:MAG: cyclic nucleotide-binding domain-containing protein [Opitutus sp.]|nr:cyclic nucleotide-binding domain-containing protein [Opitutus sp.]